MIEGLPFAHSPHGRTHVFVNDPTMGYSLHVMSVEPSGNEWISFMAMRKTNSGSYRDVVVVMSPDQPTYQPGEKVKVYCTCTGAYEVTDEDNKVTEYPSFDLLFWEED